MDFYVDRKNGAPMREGCYGIKVGGTNYNADSRGRVTVDNPDHVRLIEQSARDDGGRIQKATGTRITRTSSKRCEPCRFTAYRFSTVCPKCGGPLELKGES